MPFNKKKENVDEKKLENKIAEKDIKQCPYCGEEILTTAKKCKHCGEWLEK